MSKIDEYQHARRKAIRLMNYYLGSARSAAGLSWSEENDAEVSEMVDAIIAAAIAKEEMRGEQCVGGGVDHE